MEKELERQTELAAELAKECNEVFDCVNEPLVMPVVSDDDQSIEGPPEPPASPRYMIENEETGEIEEYDSRMLDEIVAQALNIMDLERKTKSTIKNPPFPT